VIIGYYSETDLSCLKCVAEGEEATAEALPDGFTCASCGEVVNA
jgi:hypothetical protein